MNLSCENSIQFYRASVLYNNLVRDRKMRANGKMLALANELNTNNRKLIFFLWKKQMYQNSYICCSSSSSVTLNMLLNSSEPQFSKISHMGMFWDLSMTIHVTHLAWWQHRAHLAPGKELLLASREGPHSQTEHTHWFGRSDEMIFLCPRSHIVLCMWSTSNKWVFEGWMTRRLEITCGFHFGVILLFSHF